MHLPGSTIDMPGGLRRNRGGRPPSPSTRCAFDRSPAPPARRSLVCSTVARRRRVGLRRKARRSAADPDRVQRPTARAAGRAATAPRRLSRQRPGRAGSRTHYRRRGAHGLQALRPQRVSAVAAMPLVVMLHGCTPDPDDFAAGTGMNSRERSRGFSSPIPRRPRGPTAPSAGTGSSQGTSSGTGASPR